MSAVPARATRHTIATVSEARRLHEAGWTACQVAHLLTRRGTRVTERTVKTWLDEKFADRKRRENRERMRKVNAQRRGGRLAAAPSYSPDFRLERMRSLRALPMSFDAIAKVMTFDFPDERLTEDQVRYALKVGRLPSAERAA